MSSWTLETYEKNDIYIEYEWDKYPPHYVVFVGRKHEGDMVNTVWTNRYATKESARRAFKRQVAKLEKGE